MADYYYSCKMNTALSRLFGSNARLKILRLFFLNPDKILSARVVSSRGKVSSAILKKELRLLSGIGFIERKKGFVVSSSAKSKTKKKIEGWGLNSAFPLFGALKNLVLDTTPVSRREILKKLSKIGKLKLVILAGIFIQNPDSRVDILIVGDGINKNSLRKALLEVEAEVGKELNYAFFTTTDFIYRINIYDKFVRDILDYPHEKILDKIGV